MLTIKSRFINFRKRLGEVYTKEDLDLLCRNLISCDIINFKKDFVGGGFPEKLTDKIIDKITVNKNGKVLIFNDFSLHMLDKLLDIGFDLKNIYMAFGSWADCKFNKKSTKLDFSNKVLYNIMIDYIRSNFAENINIVSLDEVFNKMKGIKFDLIIANPPYAAIGANITDYIRQNINFQEYINLLPANDYKRNKNKDLFNYQSDMEPAVEAGKKAFEDAAVTTYIARIHENKVNNLTLDEFERSQYIDRSLDKYFLENSRRNHYAIDKATQALIFGTNITNATSLIIDHRYIPNKHLAYSKNTNEYKWNIERLVDLKDLALKFAGKVTFRKGTALNKYVITFRSATEKNNCATFIYSNNGFKFMSKLANALNVDSSVDANKFLPKVDWTREWTVEEILKDYGYTDSEIKEVMDDLNSIKEDGTPKYKGMED